MLWVSQSLSVFSCWVECTKPCVWQRLVSSWKWSQPFLANILFCSSFFAHRIFCNLLSGPPARYLAFLPTPYPPLADTTDLHLTNKLPWNCSPKFCFGVCQFFFQTQTKPNQRDILLICYPAMRGIKTTFLLSANSGWHFCYFWTASMHFASFSIRADETSATDQRSVLKKKLLPCYTTR